MFKQCTVINEDKYLPSPWNNTLVCFAMLGEDLEKKLTLLRGPSSCRGYLGDTIFAHKNPGKTNVSTYRFKDAFNHLKGDSFLYISFYKKSTADAFYKKEVENINKNIELLHKYEKQAGVKETEVYKTTENNFVFCGDPVWKDSVWKFMLWSFLIKNVMYEYKIDTHYWQILEKTKDDKTNLDRLLENVKNSPDHEEFKLSDYKSWDHFAIHNNAGFIAACNNTNKTMHDKLGLI